MTSPKAIALLFRRGRKSDASTEPDPIRFAATTRGRRWPGTDPATMPAASGGAQPPGTGPSMTPVVSGGAQPPATGLGKDPGHIHRLKGVGSTNG